MSTSRTPAFWLSLISLILTVSFGVAACALVSGGGPGTTPGAPTATLPTAAPAQPTAAAPTTAPGQPTVAAPTLAPVQPTAAATTAPAQPTAQPAQPIIGFNPKSGGPGTSVEVFGSGYTPGKWYSVRLGLPHPTGEVLFSAQADGSGRWGGRLIMPAALPSGQSIPSGQLFLVSMDEPNKALASAPFSFTAAEPAPPASFPGEGWTAWKQGDFNGDGLEETVFLKENGQVNYDRLEDALLNSSSLNATAVLAVQESAHNPVVLLEIDSRSARTSDGHVLPFGEGGPAFFQVAVSYAYEGRSLHVLPLKADGYAYTQALAFKWSPAHSAYRPIGGPNGEW